MEATCQAAPNAAACTGRPAAASTTGSAMGGVWPRMLITWWVRTARRASGPAVTTNARRCQVAVAVDQSATRMTAAPTTIAADQPATSAPALRLPSASAPASHTSRPDPDVAARTTARPGRPVAIATWSATTPTAQAAAPATTAIATSGLRTVAVVAPPRRASPATTTRPRAPPARPAVASETPASWGRSRRRAAGSKPIISDPRPRLPTRPAQVSAPTTARAAPTSEAPCVRAAISQATAPKPPESSWATSRARPVRHMRGIGGLLGRAVGADMAAQDRPPVDHAPLATGCGTAERRPSAG